MRIGFFTDFYLPTKNGVSTSVDSFRQHLEALGHEVFVFAPAEGLRQKEKDPHIIRFPAVKGLFVETYMTTVFFPPKQVRDIEKLNLDIIHFHTPSQIGLLGAHVAIKKDIPLVTTYHTDLHQYTMTYPIIGTGFMLFGLLSPLVTGGGIQDTRKALKGLRLSLDRQAMNQRAVEQAMTLLHNYCDLVIAPSKKMAEQLKRWHTESRVEILPTGVDKITTTPAEVAARKAEYGLLPEDKVVLNVGRLTKEKNLELLIKAFARVKKAVPEAKLLLAGDAKHSEFLLDLAIKLGIPEGAIVKTGYVENNDLGSVLACADVFASPSLTDTQSLVLNEAAHAGLPIVGVDPLINDVVQPGVNGYYTKPNIQALARAITKLLSNDALRAKMGKASEIEAKKFSETAQAKKLAALYEEVLAKHRVL